MNNKNKLLVVLALTTATSVIPHGGGGFGGGFATGAILGTGLTLAATSGNRGDRSDAYYENKRIEKSKSEINRQIREERTQRNKAQRALGKARNKGDQQQVKQLTEEINSHNETIKELKAELRDLQ